MHKSFAAVMAEGLIEDARRDMAEYKSDIRSLEVRLKREILNGNGETVAAIYADIAQNEQEILLIKKFISEQKRLLD
jgi:hypothetical protein